MSKTMRLSAELAEAAEREGSLQKRSAPKQIEYWAELGKAVERVLSPNDVVAVVQGLKVLHIEPRQPVSLDSDEIFGELDALRESGELSELVTSAPYSYEASTSQPGLLERVDNKTGQRDIGQFRDGVFKVVHSTKRKLATA